MKSAMRRYYFGDISNETSNWILITEVAFLNGLVLLGKVSGNPWVFTIKLMGFSCKFFPKPIHCIPRERGRTKNHAW
jgi:hypothetical protein